MNKDQTEATRSSSCCSEEQPGEAPAEKPIKSTGEGRENLLEQLATNRETGLSPKVAAQRLSEDGPNELSRVAPVNPWVLLFEQFKSSVVILLVVSTVISTLMKEYLQSLGIVAALAINAGIGFFTEYRAKVSLDALSKMSGATVRVRRGGGELELPVRELVRGDIVVLTAGVRVPADLQILDCASFSVDESPLTGESVPVFKTASLARSDQPEGHHANLVFQGTGVLTGRALCVVTATGARTRIGQLGKLIQETVSGETPLTRSLDVLGHQLTILVIVLSVIFGILGVFRHVAMERMLDTSIALAVAAIPEGLPVIATLALAAGIRRMIRAKALVRRLPAVETLGCTTVICTDKTGTLTENKMVVTNIVLAEEELQLTGRGYEPTGEITSGGVAFDTGDERLSLFLSAICLCNDARLENHGAGEGWHIHGDPTEGSLITAAVKLGRDDQKLRDQFPRIAELPFDLDRKRMSTIHLSPDDGCVVFCKGAPGVVLPLCTQVKTKAGTVALTEQSREWFLAQNNTLAGQGLRALAVATREIDRVPDDLDNAGVETELTLLGLVAMSDRPREEVEQAIKRCQTAGMRVVMLTGDQPATARAVAEELGIIKSGANSWSVLTGAQLNSLQDGELDEALEKVAVLARVTPEMKLFIVKRLQARGEVVAMTGDGINDAPALRQSNIGIAMGQEGTDMAREASDLVITDDNFATIVKAVEQGRITYSNISRAVGYLLTASLASVVAITLGLLANTGLFLQPLQLLYLNLIMHIFPGLGVVMQKNADGVMKRPPRPPSEQLLNRYEQIQIVSRAVLVSLVSLLAIYIDQRYFGSDSSMTVALSTLSLLLTMQSWAWLSVGAEGPVVRWHLNLPMLVCTAINLLLLAAAIYFPPFQLVLNTSELNAEHWLLIAVSAIVAYLLSLPMKNWGRRSTEVAAAGPRPTGQT